MHWKFVASIHQDGWTVEMATQAPMSRRTTAAAALARRRLTGAGPVRDEED